MLNWKARYSRILQQNPELYDPAFSVLEVGCGPVGIAHFLHRPVTGVEGGDVAPESEHLTIMRGSVLNLPFPDGQFDFVVCVNMLETVAHEQRANAITELLRVAARKVVISSPADKWAAEAEMVLAGMFERCSMPAPGWLTANIARGFPSLGDIIRLIGQTGRRFEITGNETVLQHSGCIALDWLYPAAAQLNSAFDRKSPASCPIEGSEWDFYYSFLFTIFVGEARFLATRGRVSQPKPIAHRGGLALYSVYHRDFPVDHLGPITPIYCGRSADTCPAGSLTDRLEDGTSLENARWSELSAIYKIWQEGPRSDIVGFTHYRRLWDFRTDENGQPAMPGRVTTIPLGEIRTHRDFIFDEEKIRCVNGNTMIVAKPHELYTNVFHDYSVQHSMRDYLEIFNDFIPSMLFSDFLGQFNKKTLYANNMFVCTWDIFDELCELMFTALGRFAASRPARMALPYQRRDVAFLSERIFDAWVEYRRRLGMRIVELPLLFVEE